MQSYVGIHSAGGGGFGLFLSYKVSPRRDVPSIVELTWTLTLAEMHGRIINNHEETFELAEVDKLLIHDKWIRQAKEAGVLPLSPCQYAQYAVGS
jgi:hypothetical protein